MPFVSIRQVGMNSSWKVKKLPEVRKPDKKVCILQHGAILLSLDAEKLVSLFKFKSDEQRQRMKVRIHEKAVAIDQLAGRKVSANERS